MSKKKTNHGEPTLWFCKHCDNTEPDVEGKMIKNRCKCGWYMFHRPLTKGEAEKVTA